MNELERARDMLPWLISGKLSSLEEDSLNKAMGRYPALQKDYEVQIELAKMIKRDPSVMDIAVITTQDQRLNVLMDRIRTDQASQTSFFTPYQKLFARAKSQFHKIFVPKPNVWTFTVVVAVIFVQMAILSLVMDNSELDGGSDSVIYSTASEDQAVRSNRPSIIIHFSAEASEQDIKQLINEIHGVVGQHPTGTTYYQVFLRDATDIMSLLSDLGDNKLLIDFVGRGN